MIFLWVDPSGSYFSLKALAMGKNVSNTQTFLKKRVHFTQLFMEKGNYDHVLQAVSQRKTCSSTPLEPLLLEKPS
ncbi:Proteasome subunit alpha type-2-A [Spatholobus suberectus]|nr:Proteasome subunit alpha type-2-A [Spatholobus suberectus]